MMMMMSFHDLQLRHKSGIDHANANAGAAAIVSMTGERAGMLRKHDGSKVCLSFWVFFFLNSGCSSSRERSSVNCRDV